MKTLSEIKAKVDMLAAAVGAANRDILPTYGRTEDFARPHIEVDARGYHLVVVERGREQSRLTTGELDELLSNIFAGVTSGLAFGYELAHRVEAQDCRRLAFRRQVELLARLDVRWAEEAARRHEQILRVHPFDDLAGLRARLTRKLRETGHPPEAAWKMACERYPFPNP